MKKNKTRMLQRRYNMMLAGIEDAPIYDGRGKGVDVYVCDYCGARIYTRYKDKGVTPFVMRCRKCEHGSSMHQSTIDEETAASKGLEVLNWIRPTFEQFCAAGEALRGHVLEGGLVLEGEL